MPGREGINLTGKTFGKWKVLSFDGLDGSRHRYWLCRCRCRCGLSQSVAQVYLTKPSALPDGPMCKECAYEARRKE